jgi:hypothetical protein
MKLKGRHSETVSDIQRESQAVIDNINERDFHGAFETWEKIIVLLHTFSRRLLWRRWQPKLNKLSQHFFFDLVRELSDSSSYISCLQRRDVSIGEMFLVKFAMSLFQLRENMRIVSANSAFDCSLQTIIRRCEVGWPWWPNVIWNYSVPNTQQRHGNTCCMYSSTTLLEVAVGNFTITFLVNAIEEYGFYFPISCCDPSHTNLLIMRWCVLHLKRISCWSRAAVLFVDATG